MLIVSDTTPLISLMKVSRLGLLEALYGEVLIPRAVFRELMTNASFPDEAEQIKRSSFIKVVDVNNTAVLDIGLGPGETEAISYAREVQADYLLMDEAKGRKVAKSLGLNVTGTIGILLTAFQWRMMTKEEVEASLEKLKELKIMGKKIVEYAKSVIETQKS